MSSTSPTDEHVNYCVIDDNDINQCKISAETINDNDANILLRLNKIQTDTECLKRMIKPCIGFDYPNFVIPDAVTNTDVTNTDAVNTKT